MTRKPTRTNAYPTVKPRQDIFASRPSGVTMIGPDKHVWQSSYHDGLPQHTSDNAGNMPFMRPEGIDPRNYVNKYIVGPNQKLLMGYRDAQGQYGWREEKNILSDNTVGFKLPTSEEVPASLDANAIDDKGIALNIFVGAVASYRRADALPVYWDGETFFDMDKNELYVPESFKRGIPTTYGLKGTVYIPQENYLEDLLIPIEDQELSFPTEYHPKASYASINVKPDGRHEKTNRKVGNQNAKECFESAWEQAVFEIEDIFTMPGAPYRERRAILETFIKPLKDAYKQIRLIPTMPIHSKEWAMSAYDNTPPNAYLVLIDPDSVFEGAVDPKEKAAPRKRRPLDQKEFAGPLVGWKLDGSGKLEGVVVEGTSTVNKSAIVVHPGQLWVGNEVAPNDTPLSVRNRMLDEINEIKKLRDSAGEKLPSEFINRMVKAYEDDFDLQTRSRKAIDKPVAVNRAKAARSIRNLIGTKLWDFTIPQKKRDEYNGVPVTSNMVNKIMDFTTKDVFAPGIISDSAVVSELIRQLGKFVKMICTDIVSDNVSTVTVSNARINTSNVGTFGNFIERIYNAMTAEEKASMLSSLHAQFRVNPMTYLGAREIGQKYADAATGNPFSYFMSGLIINGFLHTDQDSTDPLDEAQLKSIYNITARDYSTAVTKNGSGDDVLKLGASATEEELKDVLAFRKLAMELVGRLIQSIKPGPLFVYHDPKDAKFKPNNLLKWSSAQTVYFQRSFPYGALIHFKVVKGDSIDESTKMEDSYAMTKVTVV